MLATVLTFHWLLDVFDRKSAQRSAMFVTTKTGILKPKHNVFQTFTKW